MICELSLFAALDRRVPSVAVVSLLGEGEGDGVASGDGGGVCSYLVRVAGCAEAEEMESSLCARFSLLVWRYSEGEGEDSDWDGVALGVGVEADVEDARLLAAAAAAAAARAACVTGT